MWEVPGYMAGGNTETIIYDTKEEGKSYKVEKTNR